MDLRIPGNLNGNAGDSVGGEMAATGATVGRIGEVFDTIQANFDYNDASALKYQSDLEKQDYHVKFWQGEDGSDPESMKRYNEGLGKIDQNYIDRAYKVNNRVGGYVQKDAAAVSANLTQEAHKVYYNKFLNKSIETDKNETDRATKRAIMTGEFGLELQNNMVRLESRRPIYGDNVDGVITDANAYMAENFIRGRLANQTTAAEFLKRVQDNPEYKQNLYQHLPATKIDEMEKLMKEGKDKSLGAYAFQDTLNAAAQLPEVQEGKVSQMDAAQRLWMNPETITKYGITDDQWRNGMLNFDKVLTFRDKEDEKAAGEATIGMSEKYVNHQLTFDDIKATFANIQNPELKAKYVEQWTRLLDSQAAQARANASAERAARAAEMANNPFNKDIPEVKAQLMKKSIETPNAPGLLNEVNLALGNGVSIDTYKTIMGNISKGDVWKSATGKEFYKTIRQAQKDYKFSTNDDENNARYFEMLNYYKGVLEANPNADLQKLNADFNGRLKEYKKGMIRKILDGHYGDKIYNMVNHE